MLGVFVLRNFPRFAGFVKTDSYIEANLFCIWKIKITFWYYLGGTAGAFCHYRIKCAFYFFAWWVEGCKHKHTRSGILWIESLVEIIITVAENISAVIQRNRIKQAIRVDVKINFNLTVQLAFVFEIYQLGSFDSNTVAVAFCAAGRGWRIKLLIVNLKPKRCVVKVFLFAGSNEYKH